MRQRGVIMRVRSAAILALVLAQAGCGSSTEPAGLLVTTEVAPRAFRPGAEAIVTITVVNAGFRPRVFQGNICTGFEVLTPAGQVVGPHASDCDGSSNPYLLLPGERAVFTRTWAGNGPGETMFTSAALPPGEYLLRARIGLTTLDGGPLPDPPHVDSKPVAVTLTP